MLYSVFPGHFSFRLGKGGWTLDHPAHVTQVRLQCSNIFFHLLAAPCPRFTCQAGTAQKGADFAKSKESTQDACQKKCCATKTCIGFGYLTLTKDCWLSRTTWAKHKLTRGLFNLPIPYMTSCQSSAGKCWVFPTDSLK